MKKFTILMSVYVKDSASFLKAALDSIIFQTSSDFEVLLVNDGALTDELYDVIDVFKDDCFYKNIPFLNLKLKDNVGLGGALREGLTYCHTPYVVRMDSDDISVYDRIAQLAKTVEAYPDVDVMGTYIEEFHEKVGDLKRFRKVPLTHDAILKCVKIKNPMNHVTVCMKTTSVKESGNYENVLWHEDYYLWFKMISQGFKFINIPVTTVFVRVGNDLVSRRAGLTYIKSELNFLKRCRQLRVLGFIDSLTYIFPRVIIRCMPRRCVSFIYSFLRKRK